MDTRKVQHRIMVWIVRCFGVDLFNNKRERIRRFNEEVIELNQALGVPKEDILAIIEHVYSKPVGEAHQEIGGVGITLLALCHRLGYDFGILTDTELRRVESLPADYFRKRQIAKAEAGISLMPTETETHA